MTLPPDWLWIVLVALGAFFARDIWPLVRSLIGARQVAEDTDRRSRLDHEERQVVAAERQVEQLIRLTALLEQFGQSAAQSQTRQEANQAEINARLISIQTAQTALVGVIDKLSERIDTWVAATHPRDHGRRQSDRPHQRREADRYE